MKRDEAYWEAERIVREQKAAEKAAAKAAREAAEAARPKKPRHEKQTTVPLPPPEARNMVTNECVRAYLVDPPATGAENAAACASASAHAALGAAAAHAASAGPSPARPRSDVIAVPHVCVHEGLDR